MEPDRFCLMSWNSMNFTTEPEILNGTQLYDVKGLLAISVGVVFSGVVITFINKLLWLKYTILVVVLVALIINRKRVFSALKSVLGK